jgi:hypothetical protein
MVDFSVARSIFPLDIVKRRLRETATGAVYPWKSAQSAVAQTRIPAAP